MANTLYDVLKNKMMKTIENDPLRVYLIDTSVYTFDVSHTTLADIPVEARVATAQLTNTSLDNYTLDADNVLFNDVVGPTVSAFAVVYDVDAIAGNDESLAELYAYSDESEGLPVTPDGRPIAISWTDTTSKVITL